MIIPLDNSPFEQRFRSCDSIAQPIDELEPFSDANRRT
jgi:hypothetical protein